MVGWSNVSYIRKQKTEELHFAAPSSPVTFMIVHIRPTAILLLNSSPVNGGVVCSPKVVVTLALNHTQLLCLFFVLSFLPLCVFQPSLLPFHPNSLFVLLPYRVACSEICTQRSSAPLRTCSWMAKARASCCSPGVASASHGMFSSECAERTLPTTHSSRSVLVAYRRPSTTPWECFTLLSYQLLSATSPGKKTFDHPRIF